MKRKDFIKSLIAIPAAVGIAKNVVEDDNWFSITGYFKNINNNGTATIIYKDGKEITSETYCFIDLEPASIDYIKL